MYDFLISGQGIAGSLLAIQLIEAGKSVMVISDEGSASASDVAAGLYNPLLVKRIRKAWLADTLFPLIEPFYTKLEQQLNCRDLLHPKALVHVFETQAEQNDWAGKQNDPAFSEYISFSAVKSLDDTWFANPYGVMQVKHTGWVNTRLLVSASKQYLLQHHAYKSERIDFTQLKQDNDCWTYKNTRAKAVICCEGAGVSGNPYFNYIPFAPAKGEILTIEVPGLALPYTIHRGIFLMPQPDGNFRVGSTYEWDELGPEPTEKARLELTQKLDELLLQPYNIIAQQAGIRPASMDRRPVLGEHMKYKQLYIFNGLGTKAVSLMPYCSGIMLGHLLSGAAIPKELSLERFSNYYK